MFEYGRFVLDIWKDICTRRFQTRSSHKPQQSLRRSVLQNNMKYARAVQILLLLLTLQLWVATASGLPFLQRFWSPLNLNHRRSAPRFPTNFQANYTFSLPYVSAYQKQGLSYPISVWKNGDHLRIDSGDGSDGHAINSLITQPDAQFELSPRIDRMNCLRLEKDDDIELQNTAFGEHALNAVLPDMAHWEFRGSETLDSKDVDLWVLEQKHEAKVVLYKFWVEPLEDEEYDRPVLLTLHGNALDGSHFDDWRYEFQSFTPRAPSESVFALPALCATVAAQPLSCRTPHAMRMLSLLPPTIKSFGDDPAYALFSAVHGRTHESHADFSVRLGAFRSSLGLIAAHNAKADKSYTLAINKFADWTEEEFRGVMLPGRGLRANKVQPPAELLHQRTVPADRIPRTVDWSKTGADQVVKDQSACGSCWAFGAAGAMQASWFMHTGEQLLFSEQQLMDCSWGHTENKACDGGLAEGAFDWAAKNGGVALESNIPYRGQDDFCTTLDGKSGKSRSGQRIKFKGYKEVAVDDNEAVMEALYTKGPLAISIDAGQPGFRFYSEGVYDELTCGWKAADLDHSVMLVGYGETEGGKEYWHVKNSWSQAWGTEGYIKISRDHHGCGVPTNALYGIPDV